MILHIVIRVELRYVGRFCTNYAKISQGCGQEFSPVLIKINDAAKTEAP